MQEFSQVKRAYGQPESSLLNTTSSSSSSQGKCQYCHEVILRLIYVRNPQITASFLQDFHFHIDTFQQWFLKHGKRFWEQVHTIRSTLNPFQPLTFYSFFFFLSFKLHQLGRPFFPCLVWSFLYSKELKCRDLDIIIHGKLHIIAFKGACAFWIPTAKKVVSVSNIYHQVIHKVYSGSYSSYQVLYNMKRPWLCWKVNRPLSKRVYLAFILLYGDLLVFHIHKK